jgi:hypothetical protein
MKKLAFAGFLATGVLAVMPAQAAILVPGGAPVATPVVGALGTDPFGAVHGAALATVVGPETTQLGATHAFFWAAVYRDTSTGFLDFYYQVQNTAAAGTDAQNRETDQPFNIGALWTTDAYQTPGSFGVFVAGNQTSDTADRSANGQTVGFNFGASGNGSLDVGETSFVKIIRTNATAFTTGTSQVIDGGISGRPTFSPLAVPEPGSMLLLGTGLLAIGRFVRRRKS